MIVNAVETIQYTQPGFHAASYDTVRKLETVLTITLAAQMVGLVLRYTL